MSFAKTTDSLKLLAAELYRAEPSPKCFVAHSCVTSDGQFMRCSGLVRHGWQLMIEDHVALPETQQSQAQAAFLGALRIRHRDEVDIINARQATELAELRSRQTAEEQAAFTQTLQLHQESAAHLASQQLKAHEVSAFLFLKEYLLFPQLLQALDKGQDLLHRHVAPASPEFL